MKKEIFLDKVRDLIDDHKADYLQDVKIQMTHIVRLIEHLPISSMKYLMDCFLKAQYNAEVIHCNAGHEMGVEGLAKNKLIYGSEEEFMEHIKHNLTGSILNILYKNILVVEELRPEFNEIRYSTKLTVIIPNNEES